MRMREIPYAGGGLAPGHAFTFTVLSAASRGRRWKRRHCRHEEVALQACGGGRSQTVDNHGGTSARSGTRARTSAGSRAAEARSARGAAFADRIAATYEFFGHLANKDSRVIIGEVMNSVIDAEELD